MPQHGAHGFQRHTVGQRNGGGKCVPRGVRGEVLINAAEVCYFFEVSVKTLIAFDGQQYIVGNAVRVFAVLPQDLFG